ncbi:MAG TPA: sugar transferase, partial [Ktedonobacterales bacterium]
MASKALREHQVLAPPIAKPTLVQPQVLRTPAYASPPSLYDRAKRAMDVLLGGLLMVPFGVLMGIIALLIKRDSVGPVFFLQERIGANGKPFKMYKFRTMVVNNDDSGHREAVAAFMNGQQLSDGDPDSIYKLKDDARVTRVGRILRKLSLDELPQLINVVQGSMSLVGPRPPLDYEVECYSEHDMLRLQGKPG